MRDFLLEDLEIQRVNSNFQVVSLTFLELRSANAIRLTIDKTNVVCVPPDPFCHITICLVSSTCDFAVNFFFKCLVCFCCCPYSCFAKNLGSNFTKSGDLRSARSRDWHHGDSGAAVRFGIVEAEISCGLQLFSCSPYYYKLIQ